MSEMSGEIIFGIVSMLLALVLWVRVLMNKRNEDDWISQKLLERQQKLDASKAPPPASPPSDDSPQNGPWG